MLVLKDEVFRIVGAAMEVHRRVGPGFLEAVYQECLGREFARLDIPFVEQPKMSLEYRGEPLKKHYEPDFLAFGSIVIEIKARRVCTAVDMAQVINALRVAGKPVGILMNFGEKSLFWKRFANTRERFA